MKKLILLLALAAVLPGLSKAQTASTPQTASPADYILLTIFLKHDQSKNLDEINREMAASNFWAEFPPAGVEVESWYVMMGVGQVIVLRVPPSRLREVNLAVEKRAWKAFRTEFYPTYDFKEIAKQKRAEALAAQK